MGLCLHVSAICDRFPSLQVDAEAEILRYKVCDCVVTYIRFLLYSVNNLLSLFILMLRANYHSPKAC